MPQTDTQKPTSSIFLNGDNLGTFFLRLGKDKIVLLLLLHSSAGYPNQCVKKRGKKSFSNLKRKIKLSLFIKTKIYMIFYTEKPTE